MWKIGVFVWNLWDHFKAAKFVDQRAKGNFDNSSQWKTEKYFSSLSCYLLIATHGWDYRSAKTVTDYHMYYLADHSDVIRLFYHNIRNFNSNFWYHRIESNYLGAECLTRPHLCDRGFTVTFNITGKTCYYLLLFSFFFFVAGVYLCGGTFETNTITNYTCKESSRHFMWCTGLCY